MGSVCVNRKWLIALHGYYGDVARAYSLPNLVRGKAVAGKFSNCDIIGAGSDDRMYVGCYSRVALLEISEEGNLTFRRNLTAGGQLAKCCRRYIVAVDSRPGQLWVAPTVYSDHDWMLYLMDVNNDSILQSLEIVTPTGTMIRGVDGLAVMGTGELLLSGYNANYTTRAVLLYQSNITLPSTLVAVSNSTRVLLSHRDRFLVCDYKSGNILILDSKGELDHTVDDHLHGKHGVSMRVRDVAVWEDHLIVCDFHGYCLVFSML